MTKKRVSIKSPSIDIAFHQAGNRPTARYVSAAAVCEEALEHGRWIGVYWSATGHVHRENVVPGLPGLPSLSRPIHAFELEIDGQSLHNRWDLIKSSRRPGNRPETSEAVVELKHQIRPVTLKVITRLDGSPVLARHLEITNTGKAPAALGSIAPWSGVLWNTNTSQPYLHSNVNPSFTEQDQSKFSLGYLVSEDWGHEGDFVWQSLPPENFRIERKQSGRCWGSPYYILRNEATGELFFIGLAWGGNFFAEFAYRHESLLSFRIGPLAPAPLRIMAPGETVTSPEVHLGPMHSSFDEAVGLWHRHMRTSVIPARPKGKEMYTVAARVVEEPGDWIKKEIDIAAQMGVEAYMVDAGWYGESFAGWWDHRGDWFEGSWLPGGMKGLRDHTQKHGMLFGLWQEAEAMSKKSRLFEKHPDWILKTDDGRECAEALDLANPDAAKYFEDSILNIIKGFKLDFYKLDYNVHTGEGGQTVREGYAESEFWRHTEAVHKAYDRVLKECPNVCLENCGGGGGRNDLGMLSRFHYACESDWSVMPYSIRAINALSLFIPPESICYYHNHAQHAHQVADLDTHLRITLFAVPIYVGFGSQGADRSTEYFEKARRYIGLHKGFCRPVLAGHPVVYHHTPDIGLFKPSDWCVLEYATPDRSRGYAGVFKLVGGYSEYRFRPRGVEASATYQVTLDNRRQVMRLSGQDLLLHGIPVELDAALTSELIMFEKTQRK
jgi:alpha-galactosidase